LVSQDYSWNLFADRNFNQRAEPGHSPLDLVKSLTDPVKSFVIFERIIWLDGNYLQIRDDDQSCFGNSVYVNYVWWLEVSTRLILAPGQYQVIWVLRNEAQGRDSWFDDEDMEIKAVCETGRDRVRHEQCCDLGLLIIFPRSHCRLAFRN
jgi:hypothetical protein